MADHPQIDAAPIGFKTRVRHVLVGIGLERMVVLYWHLTGRKTAHLAGDRRERFRAIYKSGHWTHGNLGHETLSGYGSTLDATSTVRRDLPLVLADLSATSLVDIGCGDFNWMKAIALPCSYTGVDIVPEIIEANRDAFGSADRQFFCIDAAEEPLPRADAALCREVLFHLSFVDGVSLIDNIRASGARYLLATSDPAKEVNIDIPTGDWRDINLELKPYNLGAPVRSIADGDGPNRTRVLGVWKL